MCWSCAAKQRKMGGGTDAASPPPPRGARLPPALAHRDGLGLRHRYLAWASLGLIAAGCSVLELFTMTDADAQPLVRTGAFA